MKIVVILFAFFIISEKSIFSQTLKTSEIFDLHNTIANFLVDKEIITEVSRKSEFIIIMLKVNSEGKIENIKLLSDDSNKDSTLSYLKQMNITVFKNWKSDKSKEKVIIVPILSLGQKESPEYINNLLELYPIRQVKVIKETNKIIEVDALRYRAPFIQQSTPQETEVIKKVKNN